METRIHPQQLVSAPVITYRDVIMYVILVVQFLYFPVCIQTTLILDHATLPSPSLRVA